MSVVNLSRKSDQASALHKGDNNPVVPYILSKDDFLSRVTSDVVFNISSYLDLKEILRLGRTSRTWRDLTNDQFFWHLLLLRDFGEEACQVIDENFKRAYFENYDHAERILQLMTKVKEISLLEIEKNDMSMKICGLISIRTFENYIDNLPKSLLGKVFCKSVKYKLTHLSQAIIRHHRFKEICPNSREGLGKAFSYAAKYGLIEVMRAMMNQPNFNDIEANHYFGLGRALLRAAKHNQVESIREIMTHRRYIEINANGRRSVGQAYVIAAKNRCVKVLKEIGQNQRFQEIQLNGKRGLGQALYYVSCFEMITSLKDIIKHPNFAQIEMYGDWGYLKSFVLSAKLGNFQSLKEILKHSKVLDVDEETFQAVYDTCSTSSFRLSSSDKLEVTKSLRNWAVVRALLSKSRQEQEIIHSA